MRVSDLLDHLQKQEVKLTLPNIASITEQQLGGFLCNGIHGSGIGFGSFDELMEKMWVAVPKGELGTTTKSVSDSLFLLLHCVTLDETGIVRLLHFSLFSCEGSWLTFR